MYVEEPAEERRHRNRVSVLYILVEGRNSYGRKGQFDIKLKPLPRALFINLNLSLLASSRLLNNWTSRGLLRMLFDYSYNTSIILIAMYCTIIQFSIYILAVLLRNRAIITLLWNEAKHMDSRSIINREPIYGGYRAAPKTSYKFNRLYCNGSESKVILFCSFERHIYMPRVGSKSSLSSKIIENLSISSEWKSHCSALLKHLFHSHSSFYPTRDSAKSTKF